MSATGIGCATWQDISVHSRQWPPHLESLLAVLPGEELPEGLKGVADPVTFECVGNRYQVCYLILVADALNRD